MSEQRNDNGEDAHDRAVALQELICVCEGCRERSFIAAESVRDPWLSYMLARRAGRWRHLRDVLRGKETTVADEPQTSTRIRGSLHRALIKIKSALDDDHAIAASCADQEAFALRVFLSCRETSALLRSHQGLREAIAALRSVEIAPDAHHLHNELVISGSEVHQN